MSDEQRPDSVTSEPETTQRASIRGCSITLDSGANVWGGLHEESIYWRFTSTEGAKTDIRLSTAAMSAMLQIYQGLIGCDHDFVGVKVEPKGGAKA